MGSLGYGCCHGLSSFEEGRDGSREGHWQRGRQGSDELGGLHVHQRCHRPHGCLCACMEDPGRLRSLLDHLPKGRSGLLEWSLCPEAEKAYKAFLEFKDVVKSSR